MLFFTRAGQRELTIAFIKDYVYEYSKYYNFCKQ